MELLSRTLKSFRYVFGHNGSFTLLMVSLLLCIEVGGRKALSDWHDMAIAAGLGVVAVLVAYQHHRSPLPWLRPATRLAQKAGDWLKEWFVEIGYDLRGEPRVKRGLPPIIFGLSSIVLAWSAVLLAF